eukprot:jgi/Tetstr1/432244/TSEL_002280.t1
MASKRALLARGVRPRNPLQGPRPEPNLAYGRSKARRVNEWLTAVPDDGFEEPAPEPGESQSDGNADSDGIDTAEVAEEKQQGEEEDKEQVETSMLGASAGRAGGGKTFELAMSLDDLPSIQHSRGVEDSGNQEVGRQGGEPPCSGSPRPAAEGDTGGDDASAAPPQPPKFWISQDIDEMSDVSALQRPLQRPDTRGGNLPAVQPGRQEPPASESQSAKPLDFVLGDGADFPREVAVAAGLFMAQAEARLPQGAGEAAMLRAGLCAAVSAKQKQAEAARKDLAAARAAVLAAEQRANERVKASHHAVLTPAPLSRAGSTEGRCGRGGQEAERQADTQRGRALGVESELAQLQLSHRTLEADTKRRLGAAKDREDALLERVQRMEREMEEHSQQTRETMDKYVATVTRERDQAQERAAQLAAQLKEVKARTGAAAAAAEKELGRARAEIRQLRARLAATEVERDEAIAGWEDEAAARMAAQASESRMLQAISVHDGVVDGLRQKEEEKAALRKRAAIAGDRAAAAAAAVSPEKKAEGEEERQEAELLAARDLAHPALRGAIRSGRRELQRAELGLRAAALEVKQLEAKVARGAYAAAPEFLRAVGLAFRCYLIAADAAPGTCGGTLLESLSSLYRTFVDPQALQGQGVADAEAPDASDPALVRLSHTVVVLADAALLRQPLLRAELAQAVGCARSLLLVAPAGLTLDALLEPEGGDGAGGDEVMAALMAAWPCRLQFDAARGGEWAAALAAQLPARIGLPDEALAAVPLETLRLLVPSKYASKAAPGATGVRATVGRAGAEGATLRGSPDKSGHRLATAALDLEAVPPGSFLPDLVSLSAPGLSVLRLDLGRGKGITVGHIVDILRHGLPPCFDASLTLGGGIELPVGLLRAGGAVASLPGDNCRPLDADLLARLLQGSPSLQELAIGATPLLKACPTPCPSMHAFARSMRPSEGHVLDTLCRNMAKDLEPLLRAATAHPALAMANGLPLRTPRPRGGGPLVLAGDVLALGETELGLLGAMLLEQDFRGAAAPKLAELEVVSCGLGAEATGRLMPALQASSSAESLRLLSLQGNNFGPAGAAHVAGALGSLPSLERLNLAAAGLRDDGAAAVGRSLRDGRLPRLTALSLAGNDITATGAQALAPFLRSNAALLELNMQGNHVGDAGAAALAATLLSEPAPALQRLQLNDNYSIGLSGARALGSALAGNTVLTALNLANNHLGAAGALQLANGLRHNPALTSLNLGMCKLKAEGFSHIADSLSTNTALQELGLARNSAGDIGVFALCKQLEGNDTLRSLDLTSNTITPAGAKELRRLLEGKNAALLQLHLAGNRLDADACSELEALAGRPCPRSARPRAPGATLGMKVAPAGGSPGKPYAGGADATDGARSALKQSGGRANGRRPPEQRASSPSAPAAKLGAAEAVGPPAGRQRAAREVQLPGTKQEPGSGSWALSFEYSRPSQ